MAVGDADEEISEYLGRGREVLDAIRALTGPQDRIDAAGKLTDGLRALFEEAARIRQEDAVRIYEAEKLSLAALAGRVGISKARADQIVRAARRKDGNDAGTDDGTG